MRILSILFLCLSVLTITSCGDDDGPSIMLSQADVVGTWDVDKFDTTAEILVASSGTISTTTITSGTPTITFNSDGTFTSAGMFTSTATFGGADSPNDLTGVGSGTYTVSGSDITITGLVLANPQTDNAADNELTLTAQGFTADMSLDLEGNRDNITRILGSESGTKVNVVLELSK